MRILIISLFLLAPGPVLGQSKTPKHIFDLKSRNKYNITTRHLTRTGWDITRNCETSQGPIWIKTKSTTLGQRTV